MISPTTTSSNMTNATTPSPQAEAVLSSDFETFIKMLTTQAKYQDPLEPLDSSEYAAQLAQFSMVEQQVLSNDLLTALTNQLGSSTMGQMAGWIGMEGRTTAPVLFDGAPLTLLPEPPIGAQKMELVVYNDQGNEVDRGALPVSSDPVLWAGVQQNGTPLPAGLYRFETEATGANESTLAATSVSTYARIVEVQNIGAQAQVIFVGGSEAPAASVTALREAS
ncbi:flagellar basal-body rod modification protein FlgD [Sulfitobacter undariae]|uniref:Basal-body rod modification protein FlgD n=1 Tax=Sulfitobacter undariae TaxID=1563671 RepID=A0A7W6E3V0_9RHOB|nr:flagellar hook capping FlgD N-terminal domain-containing protein [Sulfitobacter undariae]MBB3994195.1 flagellar basal-body rod modification protein FlgD [Sulfitobacter undariae]